jgi:hypothetical protein
VAWGGGLEHLAGVLLMRLTLVVGLVLLVWRCPS